MTFSLDIPKWLKIIWIAGIILTLALWGFAIWVIIKLMQHWKVI